MELRQYFTVLWRWLWLIVLGTLLAGGTAYLVSRNMTPHLPRLDYPCSSTRPVILPSLTTPRS